MIPHVVLGIIDAILHYFLGATLEIAILRLKQSTSYFSVYTHEFGRVISIFDDSRKS